METFMLIAALTAFDGRAVEITVGDQLTGTECIAWMSSHPVKAFMVDGAMVDISAAELSCRFTEKS